MADKIQYDENLWFEHLGCEGKHYLIGNPHLVPGRMWAYCPKENRTIFISKADMGEMSQESEYWVKGFLAGNQPEPPRDEKNDYEVDFEGPEYQTWLKKIEFFEQNGYWE